MNFFIYFIFSFFKFFFCKFEEIPFGFDKPAEKKAEAGSKKSVDDGDEEGGEDEDGGDGDGDGGEGGEGEYFFIIIICIELQ